MLNLNELLDIAKNEIANLDNGELFLLRDLFKDYEWNRISRSDRLLLGTLFLNYINTIVSIGKYQPEKSKILYIYYRE
jgi:hypothetical protein